MPFSGIVKPFGRGACEHEADNPEKIAKYRSIYVDHTRFSSESLDSNTYLIVGRRGTGKIALTKYYHFQNIIPNAIYVDIDEPRTLAQVASACNSSSHFSRLVTIRKYYLLWDVVIWTAIFNYIKINLRDVPAPISRACASLCSDSTFSAFMKTLVSNLSQKFLGIEDAVAVLDEYISSELFEQARTATLALAREKPIITAQIRWSNTS